MNKESKILKNLIKSTTSGDIKWNIKKIGNSIKYMAKLDITDNKHIKIIYHRNQENKNSDYIIFNYFDNNDNSKRELKEVFPSNKINPFIYLRLNIILKKLFKGILKSEPTYEVFNQLNFN